MKFIDKKTIIERGLRMNFDRKRNNKERIKFVELWAEYVRTHPDKEWSRQQKIVVDSQLRSLVPKKS
jgi:hypothetical protein